MGPKSQDFWGEILRPQDLGLLMFKRLQLARLRLGLNGGNGKIYIQFLSVYSTVRILSSVCILPLSLQPLVCVLPSQDEPVAGYNEK